jgi:hypothetical protein
VLSPALLRFPDGEGTWEVAAAWVGWLPTRTAPSQDLLHGGPASTSSSLAFSLPCILPGPSPHPPLLWGMGSSNHPCWLCPSNWLLADRGWAASQSALHSQASGTTLAPPHGAPSCAPSAYTPTTSLAPKTLCGFRYYPPRVGRDPFQHHPPNWREPIQWSLGLDLTSSAVQIITSHPGLPT